MSRKKASAAVGLLFTGAFLWLAVRNVPLHELRDVLLSARWVWIPPMVGVVLVDLVIRALRWRILLGVPRSRTGLLLRLEAIGLAVNNVLFMRIGELARAFLAGRELGLPVMTTLASVAVERALDVAALLILFCAAGWFHPEFVPPALLRAAASLLAAVIAALALLALAERPLAPGGSWERALRRWPRVHDLVCQMAAGAAVLRKPAAAAQAVVLSLALWSVDAGIYWFAARALDMGALMSYPHAILTLSWAGAGSALPAAPGAIGTFEAAVKAIVGAFGAAPSQALGFAVFVHMVNYIAVTALGLAFLWRVGLSLGELEVALRRSKAA